MLAGREATQRAVWGITLGEGVGEIVAILLDLTMPVLAGDAALDELLQRSSSSSSGHLDERIQQGGPPPALLASRW